MLMPQHASHGLVTHVGVALASETLLVNVGNNSYADNLAVSSCCVVLSAILHVLF